MNLTVLTKHKAFHFVILVGLELCSVLGVHMTGDGHNVVMLINYSTPTRSDVLQEGKESVLEKVFSALVSLDVLNMEVQPLLILPFEHNMSFVF